jgi:hypothetical protein
MRHEEHHRSERIGWLRAIVFPVPAGMLAVFVVGTSLACLAILGALAESGSPDPRGIHFMNIVSDEFP